ncbi:hypothetical protein MYX65_13220, partial [Acidobacteria bacterium AH-259-L09]|nr:hypothetical protein [Acidobacteria bacterium AH-259-L09]
GVFTSAILSPSVIHNYVPKDEDAGMSWFLSLLGFLIVTFVFALLAAPLYLVVEYPKEAEAFARISETLIPWLCIVLLLFIFNEGVKQVFSSISHAINRIRRLSAAGTTTEFEEQQRDVIPLTTEQAKQLTTYIESLTKVKKGETAWAWHFFIKYVAASIYGSQVKLLEALNDEGPKSTDELLPFYELFLSREPTASNYKLHLYLDYMTSNVLMQADPNSNKYRITPNGKAFLSVLRERGVTWRAFRG